MMTEFTEEKVYAGISLYTKFFLSIYDWLALGYFCRFIWKCPSYHMLDIYNQHITGNHLDIGVGTGYFLDKCRFPSLEPRLAIMDLNPNSLNMAGKRLIRYNPEVYRRNVLEKFNTGAPSFASIGIMNLLHCLPGNMKQKGIIFKNMKEVLIPGGTIFGSVILHKGVKTNLVADLALKWNNRKGIMTNLDDDIRDVKETLSQYFSESMVWMTGYVVFFWARI
ncbi:class I SAM-dependent methyltransferase [Chloroflexota bacterium]